MKNKLALFVGIALIVGLIGGYLVTQLSTETNSSLQTKNGSNQYGNKTGSQMKKGEANRGNCVSDDCLLVDDLEYPAGELPTQVIEILNRAIDDEYKALSTYEAVISQFGSVRPFSMIIRAEEQHISSLKSIYDKYGLQVPENKWTGNVSIPDTLQQACQIGVDAEIANAALYREELLPAVTKYEDISQVFTNLMNASQQKHLPAFDRCN